MTLKGFKQSDSLRFTPATSGFPKPWVFGQVSVTGMDFKFNQKTVGFLHSLCSTIAHEQILPHQSLLCFPEPTVQ